jgi:PST family polysaccharide transporter
MASVKKIARFSIFQFMFNFINYFSRNADNLLIGKYFSPSALGYYDKSYRLMMLPVANLTHVITPVLMPILSTYQNDKDVIYNAYIKVVKLLAIIGFPLSAFLFFTAPEIVNILYGPNWVQCIPVFRLLAITIGIQMVLSSTGSIFQAMNRTDLLFFSGSLNTVFMISGIIYGVFIEKSVESVAFGLIIAFIINFFLGFYILVKVVLDKPFFNFLDIFLLPIAISIPIVIINYLINSFCHSNIYIESLFFKFICTIILYFIMLGSMPKFRSEVLNLLKNKKK